MESIVGYRLSPRQRHLWSLLQDPDVRAQDARALLRLRGPLDAQALDAVLDALVARHEVLHTTFERLPGMSEALQVIGKRSIHQEMAEDLGALPVEARMARVEALWAARETDGMLPAARLLRVEEGEHLLFLRVHTLSVDDVSFEYLAADLAALYAAGLGGPPVADEPVPYLAVSEWLNEVASLDEAQPGRAFWARLSEGAQPPLPVEPDVAAAKAAVARRALPADLAAPLKTLVERSCAPTDTVVLAAWTALLYRLGGAEEVRIGVTSDGRTDDELQGAVGPFTQHLPLAVVIDAALPFHAVVERVRDARAHGAGLHDCFDPETALHPRVGFTSRGASGVHQAGLLEVSVARSRVAEDPFDLHLVVGGRDAGATLELHGKGFSAARLAGLLERAESLLTDALVRPEAPVGTLAVMSATERETVLHGFNRTMTSPGPAEATVPALFRAQAARTPDASAVRSGDETLSYRELDRRSDHLARRLRVLKVGPETRVGIMLPPSPQRVAAVLAVLRAGGAYVPLDPAYPRERLAFMARDAGVALVLTESSLRERVPEVEGVSVVALDDSGNRVDVPADADPEHAPEPSSAAYVIYTSGSTGTPKGVVVEHRALAVHALAVVAHYGLEPGDHVLQFSSFSFDPSVEQMLPPLTAGACVVLRGEEAQGVGEIGRCLEDGVTVLNLPTAVWHLLASEWARGQAVPGTGALRLVIAGGEAMLPGHVARWRSTPAAGVRLLNAYGPTEMVVTATTFEVPADLHTADGARSIPIGRPFGSRTAYVLDGRMEPVPVGVPGELYLGGEAVARGYLGRPEPTAERFVPDPFGRSPGARLYRTGDRVRHREDGTLEFLGRADQQVKVRGFRVEPGEVEAALERHPRVREAVVVAREDAPGERHLVGYVVGEAEPDALRAHLRGILPEHLVPGDLVLLDHLPLTPAGKVDRAALPPPEPAARTGQSVAPRTPTEEVLTEIWAEVLRLERVGTADDFFELGGHSLLVTRVIWRVREVFAVELPLTVLFERPTVAELAASVEALRRAELPAPTPIVPVERTERLPLSFAQERLWFLHRLQPEDASYNSSAALRLEGALDTEALERALGEVVRRHEALRTTLRDREGTPVQVIAPFGGLVLPVEDLSALGDAEREAEVERRISEEHARRFDLSVGPLFRPTLLRLRAEEHLLLLGMHHVATDGWSTGVLFRELSALYGAFRAGEESPLPELPVQYADYAVWQREQVGGELLERQIAYWKERLAGAPELLELPTDRPRPAVRGFRGARVPVALRGEPLQRLRALGRQEGATLYMVLLGAFQTLLSKYGGSEDVVVGSPTANRNRPETEGLIGFFVNTLALRTDLSGDPSFRELLRRVREVTLGAYEHQDLPFEKLVAELRPERGLDRSPLFQVMFALYAADPAPDLPGLEARGVSADPGTTRYDLTLALTAHPDAVDGALEYDADLFERSTADRLLRHLERVLEQAAGDAELRLSELELLDGTERRRVLEGWSRTEAGRPVDHCIHQLFQAQVERTPEAVALTFGGEALSYRELDQRANRLANHLRCRGVGPEVRVGICLERSPELVVSFLGVLKAGGAYVPLDPGYPPERLVWMAADAGVPLLLTEGGVRSRLDGLEAEIVPLDRERAAIDRESADAPAVAVTPEHLAYVIYTSGSTGRPKGIAVPHRAVPGFFRDTGYARFDAGQVLLQHSSVSWDALTLELWAALLSGGGCVLYPGRTPEPEELKRQVRAHGVTTLWLPSALFNLLVDSFPETLSGVSQVLVGGEAVSLPHVRRAQAAHPALRVVNGYGPSECTVFSTCYVVPRDTAGPTLPIGSPVGDRRVYVLDRWKCAVPPGARGELYVGGPAVARGYVGRPDLTAERFVPDPFADEPGARLYRTGDLVRWTADGVLEFLGRVDDQVKIRGFRVEPGEVEAALAEHPSVREAAVMAREDAPGEKRLVAYVVGAADGEELRSWLRRSLPEYMVPGAFVALDALPLTPNGKLDRRALPAPEHASAGERYVAPRTATEEVLAEIWAGVLSLERVGVEEGFFALGGHSLLAMRVVSRVREVFSVELPLRAIFEEPTMAELAKRVEALRRAELPVLPPVVPVERAGALPLSFGQERLWFLDRLQPQSAFYNIPAALRLSGALDAAALERALGEIVRRHEALRTTFREVGDAPVQVVAPFAGFALPVEDVSAPGEEERGAAARRLAREEAARPFDLSTGPLFRARLLRLGEEDHVLLLCVHHAVSDGWSMEVLFRELSVLYGVFREGRESPLPELPVQYADFAVWQRGRVDGEALERQLSYWRRRLSGAPVLLEVSTDRPRPPVQTYRGAHERIALPRELLDSMQALGRAEGATLFMVLLGGFQVLLGRYGGSEDVVVGSPVAGRTRGEVEGLIGFFVNTLVLRTDLSGDPGFREVLRRVREVTLGAYEHQEAPFERLVAELQPERSLSHSPLCQAAFSLETPEDAVGPPGMRARRVEVGAETTRYDLSLSLTPHAGGVSGGMQYATDLFERGTIVRMLEHLRHVLEQAAADPDRRISGLELMGGAERAQVMDWGRTRMEHPVAGTLHQRFEARAAAHPGAIAVTCGGDSLTYGALNARADLLARHLRALGVGPEARVGLCVERSPELLVGVLAVLKAGGAYVPLDPAYPAERLGWIVADSGVRVLLTAPELRDRVPGEGVEVVSLDAAPADGGAADGPAVAVHPGNLAYVVYTSGSTGHPKGVGVTHGNVLRLFASTEASFGFGEEDVWTLFHSFAFDFSVWEIWGALLHGGRLVVVPRAVSRDPAALRDLLDREGVTVLNQTPSAFRVLGEADGRADRALERLRTVIFGGEALDAASLRDWIARRGDERPVLVNMYGITETTVHVTHRVVREEDVRSGPAPSIGAPIADLRAYVLGPAGNPEPVGVPGELYVGGAGVARGYVGRPDLTAERFVPDPFSGQAGARLYRSGDRARWRIDGTLEYLGRVDQQVKVRGFRIEPGEVEHALREHPGVEDVVVAPYEHAPGDRRLAAYVVPDPVHAPAPRRLAELRRTGALSDRRVEALPDGTEVVSLNPHETAFLYDEIFERGAYLRHGITLPEDACVFDVGANIGLFTLRVARECPFGRVYAFEPIPPVCDALRLNAAVHGGDVRVLECALGDTEGEADFTFYPNASVLSGRFAEPEEEREVVKTFLLNGSEAARGEVGEALGEVLEHRLSTRRVTCRMRTLSQVIREEGVERIDLLKVDVEKSELEVLAGIDDGDWARIRQVAMEVHDAGGRLGSVRRLLEEKGFEVVTEQDAALAGTSLHDVYATRPGASAAPGATGAGAEGGDGPWRSTAELVQELGKLARQQLPEHMVPAAWVALDRIPLTANGKLDRAALPPPAADGAPRAAFAPPRTDAEQRLAAVWREVLGVERVGRHDGFFELGGHSLLLVQLQARLRERLGKEVPVVDLFRFPTVASLAERLGADSGEAAAPRRIRGSARAAKRLALAGARGEETGSNDEHSTGAGE